MLFSVYPADDRQKRLSGVAGELAASFARRASTNDWAGIFPYENYGELHEAGLLRLAVPRELGGEGASVLEVALVQARLSQGCPSTALVTTMHHTQLMRLGAGAQNEGERALYERVCRAIVEEGALLNNAASEPATG